MACWQSGRSATVQGKLWKKPLTAAAVSTLVLLVNVLYVYLVVEHEQFYPTVVHLSSDKTSL